MIIITMQSGNIVKLDEDTIIPDYRGSYDEHMTAFDAFFERCIRIVDDHVEPSHGLHGHVFYSNTERYIPQNVQIKR